MAQSGALLEHYLDLLARVLVGLVRPPGPDYRPLWPAPSWLTCSEEQEDTLKVLSQIIERASDPCPEHRIEVRRAIDIDEDLYRTGRSVNTRAFTMVGIERLHAIRKALVTTHPDHGGGSPGNYVEAGVWRGGSGIFAAEVCRWLELGASVYLYDTFSGFPTEEESSRDFGDTHDEDFRPHVSSLDEVLSNFRQFAVPMRDVHLIKGDVESTAQTHPDRPIAVLRLDVDLYRPTYAALERFWERLIPGAYVMIDDWNYEVRRGSGSGFPAREAVLDFAQERNLAIADSLMPIDHMAVMFRK